MEAMFGNLDHTAELEAPSVRAGRFTPSTPIEFKTVRAFWIQALGFSARSFACDQNVIVGLLTIVFRCHERVTR